MDKAELGRCHAPIKSRRPVLCVRRAAHQLDSHDPSGAGTNYPSQPAGTWPDGDTQPIIVIKSGG